VVAAVVAAGALVVAVVAASTGQNLLKYSL